MQLRSSRSRGADSAAHCLSENELFTIKAGCSQGYDEIAVLRADRRRREGTVAGRNAESHVELIGNGTNPPACNRSLLHLDVAGFVGNREIISFSRRTSEIAK